MTWKNCRDSDEVAAALSRPIIVVLNAGRRVFWLVSGGSAIAVAVRAARLVVAGTAAAALGNLTLTLTDERHVPIGHPDSNWQQLSEAGFDLPGARSFPVLNGQGRPGTTRSFAVRLAEELDQSDYRIGLFGIGSDGHTAGILPHSPAAVSPDLAAGYDAGNFQRITVTPRTIVRLDEIFAYAVGAEKRPALSRLPEDIAISDQPAQALKLVQKLTIFTDNDL